MNNTHFTLDEFTKSLDNLIELSDKGKIDNSVITKALRNISHLVPKKVQVKMKDGSTHTAIRWVDPTTGQAERVAKVKGEAIVSGEDAGEQVLGILNSDISKVDKVKGLFNLGIYDKKIINVLTGMTAFHVNKYLEESGLDLGSLKSDGISEEIKEVIRKEQKGKLEDSKLLAATRDEEELDLIWEVYEDSLERVMLGRHKFAIGYGTGGVGKSYTFETLAEKMELREYDREIQPSSDQYDYIVVKGDISPSQVYAELYRHRDKLVVFDDCDSFLEMKEVQGYLKAGLDTGKKCVISNLKPRKMYMIEGDKESGEIPNSFKFTGRCITITNLMASQIDQAIFSRGTPSDLTMTVDETLRKLENIKDKIVVWNAAKTEKIEVSQEARDMAFALFQEKKHILKDSVNTRVFSNTALIIDEAMKKGKTPEKISKMVNVFLNSVSGSFGESIRKQNK